MQKLGNSLKCFPSVPKKGEQKERKIFEIPVRALKVNKHDHTVKKLFFFFFKFKLLATLHPPEGKKQNHSYCSKHPQQQLSFFSSETK